MPVEDPHNLQRGMYRCQSSLDLQHRRVGDCVDIPWVWVLAFIPCPKLELKRIQPVKYSEEEANVPVNVTGLLLSFRALWHELIV